MSGNIKLLPNSVANQIAAGEVVNRPSSVIKEMVENAVDASASEIIVNFRDGGKELIQIIDNGKGMSQADARMAFERHATSKIEKVDDIYSLSTFGFRGEALASIAAVSEVELTTKQEQDALATKICITGGKFKGQQMVDAATGSKFMVRNLFYNVPARRRFLDKSTTEARHINIEFLRVALCNPNVAFSLYNNDAPVYQLEASNLKHRIIGLVGKYISNNLLEVKADTSIIRIEGFVGKPSASKLNNKDQFLFVNNRFFKSPYFHKAVLNAYDKLIPSNTQPSYFLYLTIDPEKIDVNVHPQKTEIKFEDNSAVWQIINASVRESLGKLGMVPMMDFDVEDAIEIPKYSKSNQVYREPAMSGNPDFNPFKGEENTNVFTYDKPSNVASKMSKDQISEITESLNRFDGEALNIPPSKLFDDDYDRLVMEYIEEDPSEQTQTKTIVTKTSYVGNILPLENGKYFATTIDSKLAVINVKRAYESVLYDRYKTMLSNGNSATQQLLFAQTIKLSQGQINTVSDNKADLIAFGFEFTINQTEQSMELSGLPADLGTSDSEAIIFKLIELLDSSPESIDTLKRDRLASIMSKTSSLRTIELASLDGLLSELLSCEYAAFTPEGLPVITYIDASELAKRF